MVRQQIVMSTIITVAALALAVLSRCYCSPLSPHILLVLVDDLGWSDVGYHNITNIRTPNIDQLASEGVILENYYVQPVCSPTRSALMTGRYPIHTGMQNGVIGIDTPYGLPLDLELLPQKMKEAGYATHIIGKWHLGYFQWEYTPTYRGFDTFYGMYHGAADHWTHKRDGILDLHNQTTPVTDRDGIYSTHVYTKRAEEVIDSHDASLPLFLYLPFQSVHSPVQAPDIFVNKYYNIRDKIRRTYAGMVSALDDAVGTVVNAMEDKGLWNNTLMVFSSDNGGIPLYGGYNWPLRGAKSTLWEGGVRAVAFVHGNMIEKKGRVSNDLMHVTDWFPTLASLAGLSSPSTVDGFNMWNTLTRGDPSPRTEILFNINTHGIALRGQHMKLLVDVAGSSWFTPPESNDTFTREWKRPADQYNRTGLIRKALFNITADPEERHDLSAAFPDVVAQLMERVEFYKKGMVPWLNKPPDPQANETARRKGAWGPWIPTPLKRREIVSGWDEPNEK